MAWNYRVVSVNIVPITSTQTDVALHTTRYANGIAPANAAHPPNGRYLTCPPLVLRNASYVNLAASITLGETCPEPTGTPVYVLVRNGSYITLKPIAYRSGSVNSGVLMGFTTTPNWFMRQILRILRRYLRKFVEALIDDFDIHSPNWNAHLLQLFAVHQTLIINSLTTKPTKCQYGFRELRVFGWILGKDTVEADPKEVKKLLEIPQPQNTREVRLFMGLAQYFRRLIPCFSKIAAPLTVLLGVLDRAHAPSSTPPNCDECAPPPADHSNTRRRGPTRFAAGS